jgi:peroxiredoxin
VNMWLNRLAPDFNLPALVGSRVSIADLRGYVVVLHFWSADCTWSRRADVLLVYRQLTWEAKGVRIVGVASNANETESQIRFEMEHRHLRYPVVMDFDARTADLYKAEVTPHFFVLDRQGLIRYVGALDDASEKSRDAKQFYLDKAVTTLLANGTPEPAYTQPFGCSIVRHNAAAGTMALKP